MCVCVCVLRYTSYNFRTGIKDGNSRSKKRQQLAHKLGVRANVHMNTGPLVQLHHLNLVTGVSGSDLLGESLGLIGIADADISNIHLCSNEAQIHLQPFGISTIFMHLSSHVLTLK